MAIGTWLSNKGDNLPTVYRVLNHRGEVSAGFTSDNPELPSDSEESRLWLAKEGIEFNEQNRASKDQRWTAEDWVSTEADGPQEMTT